MRLKEFENDGTKWVLFGMFSNIQDENEADEMVLEFQNGNKKFVLLTKEDKVLKEYLPS